MEDKKFALLIDSDNISSKYISVIIDEMTKYGTVTYKRIYGDWTTPQSAKWKTELIKNSITPIQQFRYTVGKNATDSTLIIDAMDILYTGNVDGFCIVSSDSDFTRLAGRLRESGMEIIGMGEKKTPRSFRAACSVFVSLDLLVEQSEYDASESTENKKANVKRFVPGRGDSGRFSSESVTSETIIADDTGYRATPDDETAYGDYTDDRQSEILHQSVVEKDIVQIIADNDDRGRTTEMGEIAARLHKKHSDFDVRNYGYSSLTQFLRDSDDFELNAIGYKTFVSLKKHDTLKETVKQFIIECVKEAGTSGVDLGYIGQLIHRKYPHFHVKSFGYSTLSKFASIIGEIRMTVDEAGRKILYPA